MSAELATFYSMNLGGESDMMTITAFVGGQYGAGVQFTINGRYCALSEHQVRRLRKILKKRLSGKYSATGPDIDLQIGPMKMP